MPSDVATTRKECTAAKPSWAMIAAVRGGTETMREAGTTYLPQQPAESPAAYDFRLANSVFSNFYSKIVRRMTSKLLQQAPTPVDVPDDIEALLDNIDLCGNSLEVFTRDMLTHAIDDGVVHILIDHPSTTAEEGEEAVTLADQNEQRPFVKMVRAANLINWESVDVDGQERLTRIHIFERIEVDDPDDEYIDATIDQVRVIRPLLVELWRVDGDGEWFLHQSTVTEFTDIPLVSLYTRKLAHMVARPLLHDVAFLNVRHWQSDSDQTAVTHKARVPILFGVGLSEAGETPHVEIGPNSMTIGQPGAELSYVEIAGNGPELGQVELDSLEDRIAKLGSEVTLAQKPGNPTATARALDQSEADIDLSAIAGDTEDALDNVVGWLGFWTNTDDPGGVDVFKDFKKFATSGDLQELLKARVSNQISHQTYLQEVQRRGLLDSDLDLDLELARVDLDTENSMKREAAVLSDLDDDPDDE